MVGFRSTFILMLKLLAIVSIPYGISEGYSITNNSAIAQSSTESSEGISIVGNQKTASNVTTDLATYSNPNLGFSLEYPSDWQKEESLTFVSPQGGIDNRSPEAISITTEILPTSDFSLDRYSEAALRQVESFQDFKLLNSSSTILAGLPAHMILYTFTDESLTPLQNLQVWTIKDGVAYIITYGGVPEEFESSLPALQNVMDSFSLAANGSGEETAEAPNAN
jgi:PsbP-like protein